MKRIEIKTGYITLGQFLKLVNCIDSGGQVKSFLQEQTIYINNELENRRGRKLKPGDIVKIETFDEFMIVST